MLKDDSQSILSQRRRLIPAVLLLFLLGLPVGSELLPALAPELLPGPDINETATTACERRRIRISEFDGPGTKFSKPLTRRQDLPRSIFQAEGPAGELPVTAAGPAFTGQNEQIRGVTGTKGSRAETVPARKLTGPRLRPAAGAATGLDPVAGKSDPRRAIRPAGLLIDNSPPPLQGASNRTGEVLIRPSATADEYQLTAFTGFLGAKLDPRLSGCLLATGMPGQVSERDWSRFLESEGLARAAYPNLICRPSWMPNDTQVGSQWHIGRINLDQAWDVTRGDNSLVIAICDTGIDTDHPDLVDKIIAGRNVADDPETTDVEDINAHGTAVAGMAAATTDNNFQIAGTAPVCKIMPVKISNLASGEATLADLIDGLAWSRQNGAQVINCSYNGPPDTDFYDAMDDEGALCFADGSVLVMAAGNDSADMGADKPWDNVIWVGSIDSADNLSAFSQYGDALDIVAPGTLVYVTYKDAVTSSGGGTASGTSFSSPCVAGVLGLMYSASFYTLTPEELRTELLNSCEDLGAAGKDDTFGWGLVDAYAAVSAVASPSAEATARPASGQAPLIVEFTGSSDMEEYKALTWSWDFGDGGTGSGQNVTHTFNQIGTYTVTLTVSDGAGLTGTDTVNVSLTYGNVPREMYLWRGQRVDYLFAPTGGANPGTVILTGGAWPPGLALAGNRLTGNPTSRGNYQVTLQVSDGVNPAVNMDLFIRVTYEGFGRFRPQVWR